MNKEDKNIIGMEYRPYDNSYCIEIKTHTQAYIASLYRTEDESYATFTVVSIPYEEEILTPRGTKTYTFVDVESNKTSKIYRTLYNENNIIKDRNKEDKNIIGMEYVPYDNSWCINIKTHTNSWIMPDYCFTEGESGATFTIVSMPYEEEVLNDTIRTLVNVESNKTGNIYRVLYRESNITKTNVEKEIKITVPEGMEIDEENSTFECIKFRPIEKRWRDDETATIVGYKINPISEIYLISSEMGYSNSKINYNLFATERHAKSALAMARISQIMANDKRFGGVITDEEWNSCNVYKYLIERFQNYVYCTSSYATTYRFLAFHTSEQRDLFLKENEDLVKDYLMIDS